MYGTVFSFSSYLVYYYTLMILFYAFQVLLLKQLILWHEKVSNQFLCTAVYIIFLVSVNDFFWGYLGFLIESKLLVKSENEYLQILMHFFSYLNKNFENYPYYDDFHICFLSWPVVRASWEHLYLWSPIPWWKTINLKILTEMK